MIMDDPDTVMVDAPPHNGDVEISDFIPEFNNGDNSKMGGTGASPDFVASLAIAPLASQFVSCPRLLISITKAFFR
jgi:hypothetical protein